MRYNDIRRTINSQCQQQITPNVLTRVLDHLERGDLIRHLAESSQEPYRPYALTDQGQQITTRLINIGRNLVDQ
jgi:DNA-binding HxlR family transcriptional regulator